MALALSARTFVAASRAFVTSLIDRQYAAISVRSKTWHATAFDARLADHGVSLADVSDAHIDQFHCRSYRPRSDCRAAPCCHEVSALRQLLRYLRQCGLCLPAPSTVAPADDLVAGFERFLTKDRGLAAGTIRYYCGGARDFLLHRFGSGKVDLRTLHTVDVISFVQGAIASAAATQPEAGHHCATRVSSLCPIPW